MVKPCQQEAHRGFSERLNLKPEVKGHTMNQQQGQQHKAHTTHQHSDSLLRLAACLLAFMVTVVLLLGTACATPEAGTSGAGGSSGTPDEPGVQQEQPTASGGEGEGSGGFVIEDEATVTVDIDEEDE
jgi:hypothetical protein